MKSNPRHVSLQAIQTTAKTSDRTGALRVTAKCAAKSIRVAWDHGLDSAGNHLKAAALLAKHLGWEGRWSHGTLKNGDHVFTLVQKETTFTVK